MVSPLWVVDMDGIPLEGCEQRLSLGGCRRCLSLECCGNGLLPDTNSHGQYTSDIVGMVGGGLEIKPTTLGNGTFPSGVWDCTPLEVETPPCEGCVVFPFGVVGGGLKIRAHYPWELNTVIVRLVIFSHLGGGG